MGLDQCRIVHLPKISDPRGNLSFVEGGVHVPFQVRRVFYVYDVPTSEKRGGHAHKALEQFMVCLSGSFKVLLDDGRSQKTFALKRPWEGLYIPPLTWTWQEDYAPGSVYLVLASAPYDEKDYLRDYDAFRTAVGLPGTDGPAR